MNDPELFTQTDVFSHMAAREICARCPHTEWCMQELARARRMAFGDTVPEGTWAGILVTNSGAEFVPYVVPVEENVTGACGTEGGWRRHRRAGTPACARCVRAHEGTERVRNLKRLVEAERKRRR